MKGTPWGRREEAPAERAAKLRRKLVEIDAIIAEQEETTEDSKAEAPAAEPAEAAAEPSEPSKTAAGKTRATDVTVVIGTSAQAQDKRMVEKIMSMVNASYYDSMKDFLHPSQTSYERLSRHEVIDRLCMGDDGLSANRVLHVAYKGERLTPESVVGCMSSTFQPPWTESGCGHWGLLVVDLDHQGQGVASVLVAAAEERLAGVCHEIQIEYEYTAGHPVSERMMAWYEGRCGFSCSTDYRRSRGTQFRKCRKPIPPEVASRGRRKRLNVIRSMLASELERIEQESSGEVAAPKAAPAALAMSDNSEASDSSVGMGA